MGVEQAWFVYCDRCCDRPQPASSTRNIAIVTAQNEGYSRRPKRGHPPEWLCARCTKSRNDELADTARSVSVK